MGGEPGGLVEAMAAVPGLAADLHRRHAPTADGRCPVCTAGPQGGYVIFPCRLYELADSARALLAQRRQGA